MSNVSSARLKARYAAERRFRALGLTAVVFSALVLAFLLFTMTANAVGGFKRAELRFPVDLAASGLTVDPASLSSSNAMAQLETAGLPDIVTMAAGKALGAEAAAEVDPQAWRDLAANIIADPQLMRGTIEAELAASDDLASALRGDGASESLKTLATKLEAEGKLAQVWDPGFLTRADATGPQAVGIWGGAQGLDADHAGHAAAGLPDRGAGGGLS